jgi:hypothetical protein
VGLHFCNIIMWKEFLSQFGYSDCKPAPTPYDASMILKKKQKDNERLVEVFSNHWFPYIFN